MFLGGFLASPLPYILIALIYCAHLVPGVADKLKITDNVISEVSIQESNGDIQVSMDSKFYSDDAFISADEQVSIACCEYQMKYPILVTHQYFRQYSQFNFLRPPPFV